MVANAMAAIASSVTPTGPDARGAPSSVSDSWDCLFAELVRRATGANGQHARTGTKQWLSSSRISRRPRLICSTLLAGCSTLVSRSFRVEVRMVPRRSPPPSLHFTVRSRSFQPYDPVEGVPLRSPGWGVGGPRWRYGLSEQRLCATGRDRATVFWPPLSLDFNKELPAHWEPEEEHLEVFAATNILHRNSQVGFHETIENKGPDGNQPCTLACTPCGLIQC